MTERISYYEVEELAAALLGKTEEYEDDNLPDLHDEFYDKFDCSMDDFHRLVELLTPMIESDESALSGHRRKGFAQNGCYIVKIEV